jgi:hypothetical protein
LHTVYKHVRGRVPSARVNEWVGEQMGLVDRARPAWCEKHTSWAMRIEALCAIVCGVLCGGAYGHAVEDARGLKCAEGVSESERERGGDGVGQRKRNEPKWQCAHKNNQRPPKGWGEIARLMAGPRSSGWLAGSRATAGVSLIGIAVTCACVCVRSPEGGWRVQGH